MIYFFNSTLHFLCFTLLLCASFVSAKEKSWAIEFDTGASWEVALSGDVLYTLSKKDNPTSRASFAKQPISGGLKKFDDFFNQTVGGIVVNANALGLNKRYSIVDIAGREFSGKAAIFEYSAQQPLMEGKIYVSFLLRDQKRNTWSGSFVGSLDDWKEAKSILQKMRTK